MATAAAPHRLRVLRWQARAARPEQALALRALLHEQGESVAHCLEQALAQAAEALGVGADTVVHIGRIELTLPAPPLAPLSHASHSSHSSPRSLLSGSSPSPLSPLSPLSPSSALHPGKPPWSGSGLAGWPDIAQANAAWSQWLQQLQQAASMQIQQAVDLAAGARTASRRPVAAHMRQALLDYLRAGWPGWALAGSDDASQQLREAALTLADELAAAGSAGLHESALRSLWSQTGTSGEQPVAAVGVLARWLALLPAALRTAWVQSRDCSQLARSLQATAPRSTVLALLASWQGAASQPRGGLLQALWLGWPGDTADASLQTRWRAALIDGSVLDAEADPALRRLQVALAADAAGPASRDAAQGGGPGKQREKDGTAFTSAGQTASAPPHAERLSAMAAETPASPSESTSPAGPDAQDDAGPWAVPLAGLVLLHPYLPRLLQGLQLHSGQAGEPLAAAVLPRALALLHALACGTAEEEADRPGTPRRPGQALELELPLIKLLLGLPPLQGLGLPAAELSEADEAEVQALLEAVRQHWPALRGSSVQTLRLSFLQRRGMLRRSHQGQQAGAATWQLQVQGEAFDLLLARLPWSLSWVKLPWMPAALQVDWPAGG